MNDIDRLKAETEKIKRDLWSLSNKGTSGADLSQINSLLSSISSQLSSLSTRMTAAENKLAEPQKTVIFDMDSSDANLNMGFANGMLPDHSIERSDLASFKYFKFYLVSGDSESVLTVNLPNSDDPASFAVNHTFAQNIRGFLTVYLKFSDDLSSITFTDMVYVFYMGSSGATASVMWYDSGLSTHGHIRKIEAFA